MKKRTTFPFFEYIFLHEEMPNIHFFLSWVYILHKKDTSSRIMKYRAFYLFRVYILEEIINILIFPEYSTLQRSFLSLIYNLTTLIPFLSIYPSWRNILIFVLGIYLSSNIQHPHSLPWAYILTWWKHCLSCNITAFIQSWSKPNRFCLALPIARQGVLKQLTSHCLIAFADS